MDGTKVLVVLLTILLVTSAVRADCSCDGKPDEFSKFVCEMGPWARRAGCLAFVAGAPFVIASIGFTPAGVAAGSMAAFLQSCFGGTVPYWFSLLQSAGATGATGVFWKIGLICGLVP